MYPHACTRSHTLARELSLPAGQTPHLKCPLHLNTSMPKTHPHPSPLAPPAPTPPPVTQQHSLRASRLPPLGQRGRPARSPRALLHSATCHRATVPLSTTPGPALPGHQPRARALLSPSLPKNLQTRLSVTPLHPAHGHRQANLQQGDCLHLSPEASMAPHCPTQGRGPPASLALLSGRMTCPQLLLPAFLPASTSKATLPPPGVPQPQALAVPTSLPELP